MPRRDQPIGVFDSGVGGLTVLRELRKQLPDEPTLYLRHEARMPYGERDREEVVRFTREAMAWFEARQCKLVVIACNTATAAALETVREEARVPIIGVIRPGAARCCWAAPPPRCCAPRSRPSRVPECVSWTRRRRPR